MRYELSQKETRDIHYLEWQGASFVFLKFNTLKRALALNYWVHFYIYFWDNEQIFSFKF